MPIDSCQATLTRSTTEESTLEALGALREQARRIPHAVALIHGDERLTYHQLWSQVAQTRRRLSERGIGRGAVVGLCVDRANETVIAVLGIVAAGAAYVAIEVDLPGDRATQVWSDARPALIVTSTQYDHCRGYPVVDLHELVTADSTDSEDDGAIAVTLDDPFTIVYTSGTTGRPKGVVITHRVVINRLRWVSVAYNLQRDDVAVLHRPYSLVSFPTEVLGPLLAGCATVVLDAACVREPATLWHALVSHGVTQIRATPASSEWIFGEAPKHRARWTSLRLAFVGGEQMPARVLERWREHFPWTQLLHGYGATECSVISSCDVTDPRTCRDGMPVGVAAPGIEIVVLGPDLRPVTAGEVGEVYVSGDSVALGYLGQPRLTADRFVPRLDGGTRMFRTGDRGRVLPDGMLEIVGRCDRQVKIRGHRVELADVEVALSECHGVRHAAVLQQSDGTPQHLVAYVELEPAAGAAVTQVRQELSMRVPQFMMPKAIVPISAMPLNGGGKIDRRALAARRVESREDDRRPDAHAERLLVDILAQVCGMKDVSLRDSFLDAGGDSLSALLAVNELNARLRLELKMVDLLGARSLGAVAARLATRLESDR
jgi:amino acid adenylation domain-containing protein